MSETIEDQIFALFIQLPAARQAVLVDTLSFATEEDDDDIEVEIVDDNEQPIGWIDDKPIHRK